MRLTNDEKILLHLLDYIKYKDEFEVPYALSQEGIGEATGIQRSHVSRAITKLEERKLVSERVSHVAGLERMRKTYYLTWEGEIHTKKIADEVKGYKLKIIDNNGIKGEMEIRQIIEEFGVKLSPWQILNLAKDGAIEFQNLFLESKKSTELVAYMEKAPKLKHFIGREKEIEDIKRVLSSNENRVVVINGISGIGKTTIALKLADDLKNEYNVYWYDFHEWDTLRNVLEPLSEFLARLNRRGLRNYLKDEQNIDLNEVANLFEDGIKNLKAVFFFDDFHKVSEKVLQFFHLFLETLERVDGPKSIIMTREIVPFYDRRDVAVKKLVAEYTLGGLEEKDAKKLIETTGKGKLLAEFESIFKATEGHPLFIELLEDVEGLKGQNVIMRYIQEEIFSKLSEEESKLLEIASVYGEPVPSEAYFIEEGATIHTLDHLIQKSLVLELENERFTLHDFVREFFYSRLSPLTKKKYHREAAKFYLMKYIEDSIDKDCIEAIYHFLAAEEYAQALQVAIKNGSILISHGYLDELETKLESFNRERAGSRWHDLLILKGDLQGAKGNFQNAISLYRECLSFSTEFNNEKGIAEANLKIGLVMLELSLWDDAENQFKSALAISEKIKDYHFIAQSKRGLGYLSWRKGLFENAISYFESAMQALQIKKESSFSYHGDEYDKNLQLHATLCIDLGNVLIEKGDTEKAIEEYTKGLEMLKHLGNMHEIARVYNNIGDAYREEGLYDKSLEFFEEAIRFSKLTGNKGILPYALTNASEVLVEIGKIDEARKYNEEANEIVRKTNDKLGIALVLKNFGLILHALGEKDGAEKKIEESIGILEKINVPFELANAYYELARILANRNKEKASDALEKSMEILHRLGAKRLLKKIEAKVNSKIVIS